MNSSTLEAEHLRPDHDAEQQLDDDGRDEQPAPRHQRRRACPATADVADDREELRRLDVDRGEDGQLAHA